MKSRRPLSQPPPFLPPARVGAAAVALFLAALLAGTSDAAAETEDVYVLTAGAVDALKTVTVQYPVDGDPHLERGPSTELQLFDDGVATYRDIAVLPGGSFLLASSSGHEAILFDADGRQRDQYGDDADPVWSAVVANFITPDDPDVLVLTNDQPGRVRLFDTLTEADLSMHPLVRQGESALLARAIALPGGRIATAARWPALDLSAVEIAPADAPADTERILWSRQAPEASVDDPVVDGIDPVRDLMADLDGRLLITSAHQVAIVDPDDGLQWQMTLGDDPTLGGEFESARWLDGGLLVVATRQPGMWNHPHVNHRLLLVDPDADTPVLDAVTGLDAAPLAMDTARGTGPTGTRHYDADAFDAGGASPSTLTIASGPSLEPPDPRFDRDTSLTAVVTNPGDEPVTVRRTEFRTAPRPCDDADGAGEFDQSWWSDDTRHTLHPGDDWELDAPSLKAEVLSVADHCGQITVVGRDGTRHPVGAPLDFTIRSPDGHGPVIVDELADHDAGPHGDPGLPSDAPEQGCACSTTPSSPSPLAVAVVLLIGLRGVRSVTQV